jgi:hypothetical protein
VLNLVCWVAALLVGAAPRPLWRRIDPRLPLHQTAFASGLLTLAIGFVIGVPGFFEYAGQVASDNNDWMLRRLAAPPEAGDSAVGLVPYGVSILTLFLYLFFTPRGLFALYLVATGSLRAIAAFLDSDDARGDPVLTWIYRVTTRLTSSARDTRVRLARERLEGEERPDVLQTGEWAGVDADYVVLASRKKAEWKAGAIIMTSTDWYKLGAPFDIDTPAGLRTAYPLKKMEAVEVLRRGIRYELPRLAGRKPRADS